jgi:electron transport complex protein RnfG
VKDLNKLLKMVIVLACICIVSALSLAWVYSITNPRIKEYEKKDLLNSLNKTIPEATRFEEEVKEQRWNAYKNNDLIGTVFKVTGKGYGGPIQILFSLDNNKNITKVIIVNQNETPGLGTKITEKKFLDQYTGKNKGEVALKKDDMLNGKIDAITAATISSRAVTNAIKEEMKK